MHISGQNTIMDNTYYVLRTQTELVLLNEPLMLSWMPMKLCELYLMKGLIMMGENDHISRARERIFMPQNFTSSVKREVRTIVSVLLSVLRLSVLNKKSSNSLLDTMDTVVIYHLMRQKNESRMVRNTPFASKFQKEKRLFSMILSVDVLNSRRAR